MGRRGREEPSICWPRVREGQEVWRGGEEEVWWAPYERRAYLSTRLVRKSQRRSPCSCGQIPLLPTPVVSSPWLPAISKRSSPPPFPSYFRSFPPHGPTWRSAVIILTQQQARGHAWSKASGRGRPTVVWRVYQPVAGAYVHLPRPRPHFSARPDAKIPRRDFRPRSSSISSAVRVSAHRRGQTVDTWPPPARRQLPRSASPALSTSLPYRPLPPSHPPFS